jgi:putative exosortase-associated protein (TIGR04073 family)
MRSSIFALAFLSLAALLSTGCAKTEKKLGRGLRNATEFVRVGEIRYSLEQTALFDGPSKAYTTGIVQGFNRTLLRTGVGIYEIVTAPFPPYGPVMTDYIPAEPREPDSYRPGMIADQTWSPDANLGFSGGEIFPMIPGSRFKVFDN